MTEKDLIIQDLRRENESLKAQLAAAIATPEIIHKPTVSEFRRMAAQLGYAPVVQGRWNGEGDGYADGEIVIDVWYCSRCGYCIDDGTDDPVLLPKYCPECGAKMEGGNDNAKD